ncbi:MAG: alpha/beta fold hydrolase [Candidatus Sulfotelmatobacter sp.]
MPQRPRTKLQRKQKKGRSSSGKATPKHTRRSSSEADISPWTEALFAAEILLLHATPVYYGFGVPRGDDSAVLIIPGFLGTDLYLMELHAWLGRIGYRPYFSGIGINAECPNLLIQRHLNETIERARAETGRKIHLIGHSLGGVIARSVAGQRPRDIASVITLAAPFRGTVTNRTVLHASEAIRQRILQEHGQRVLPDCYTGRCTCNFIDSLRRDIPESMIETAIYTRQDGIVDWRYCITKNPAVDFEVPGTHIGMAFNPSAYSILAERLALARSSE